MKKTLAILLSVLMVLSMAALGVSAAEATPVASAADFAAMAPDGNYKLTADIAIDATYGAGETVVPFTGTFDGNGHTVTISVPMFNTLDGATVKNLIINGAIVKDSTDTGYAASVALYGKTTLTLDNIVTNVNITCFSRVGGIIAQINNGTTATVTNCVNNGTILETEGSGMMGGIIGYVQGKVLTIENCVNNGSVTAKGNTAGIIGRFGGDNYDAYKDHFLTIKNCLNTGAIEATGSNAGGIIGYARGCTALIQNCTNEGTVKATSDCGGIFGSANVTKVNGESNKARALVEIDKCVNKGDVTGPGKTGGMGGYLWASADFNRAIVTNCVNYGTITTTATGQQVASQFFAYTNCNLTSLKNNVGLGKVVASGTPADAAKAPYTAVLGFSSADIPTAEYISGNLIAENDGTEYATFSVTAGKETNNIKLADVAADQLVTPDMIKVVSSADAQVAVRALGTIGYVAPTADPTNPDAPATGDTAMIAVVLCAVSLLGMGIALKSRKA